MSIISVCVYICLLIVTHSFYLYRSNRITKSHITSIQYPWANDKENYKSTGCSIPTVSIDDLIHICDIADQNQDLNRELKMIHKEMVTTTFDNDGLENDKMNFSLKDLKEDIRTDTKFSKYIKYFNDSNWQRFVIVFLSFLYIFFVLHVFLFFLPLSLYVHHSLFYFLIIHLLIIFYLS